MQSETKSPLRSLERLIARLSFDARKRRRFYGGMVALMRAGLSRSEAVEVIWQVASNEGKQKGEALAVILADVNLGMQNGQGFGKSLRPWVPRDDCMVIETIEDTDRFAEHLGTYCQTMGRKANIQNTVLGSLAYPAFLLVMAYGLLVYFDVKIVSALDGLLARANWTGMAATLGTASELAVRYGVAAAIAALVVPLLAVVMLPRWSRYGRTLADKLPLLSLYRMQSGISFLQSIASLMASGISATEAIRRVRSSATPYARYRMDLVFRHLLNGNDLGTSMHLTGTGWPDPELNLSLKILSRTPDFPSHLPGLLDDWLDTIQEDAKRKLAVLRTIAFLIVFAVISSVIYAMYDIQGQITSGL